MNINQHRSATFKWQGLLCVLCATLAFMPLPFVVADTATVTESKKMGSLEIEGGAGGIGGHGFSKLLFEDLKAAGDKDSGRNEGGGNYLVTAGDIYDIYIRRSGKTDNSGEDLAAADGGSKLALVMRFFSRSNNNSNKINKNDKNGVKLAEGLAAHDKVQAQFDGEDGEPGTSILAVKDVMPISNIDGNNRGGREEVKADLVDPSQGPGMPVATTKLKVWPLEIEGGGGDDGSLNLKAASDEYRGGKKGQRELYDMEWDKVVRHLKKEVCLKTAESGISQISNDDNDLEHTMKLSLCETHSLVVYFLALVLSLLIVTYSITSESKMKRGREMKVPRKGLAVKHYCGRLILVGTIVLVTVPPFASVVWGHQTDVSASRDGVAEMKSVAITTEPYTIGESMKRLKSLRRDGLRGSKVLDSADVINGVKDVVRNHLGSMTMIQQHLQDDEKDEAGLALKAMAGDADSLDATSKEVKEPGDLFDASSLSLSDVPNDQLVRYIPSGSFGDLVEHIQDIHQMLEGIDLSILSKSPSLDSKKKGSKQNSFQFDFGSPGSGFTGDQSRFFQSSPNMNSQQNNMFKNPSSFKNVLHHHRSSIGVGGLSMPMLSRFTNFHNDEIVMAKHQLRREALGDICSPCSLTDSECLCKRLFRCVQDMSEYDLAVLVAGGFVDTNPSSATYGAFTVPVAQLNLYNADDGVGKKLAQLKAEAVDSNTGNEGRCDNVLQDLFSACNPDDSTCTNPNVQSFAVTTDQVCAAVNTPKKLLFESIGDEFDGFADPFNIPTHYLACGGGSGGCNAVDTHIVADHELRAVRCCSDTDPHLDRQKKPGCNVWGVSELPAEDDCHEYVSFTTANDICEDNGARLCTKDELLDGCTRGSGCAFNDKLIWSSDIFMESLPLSFDTCAEFAVEFDRLYEGRKDTTTHPLYPLNNPMLRNTSKAVHDQTENKAIFDRIHFPIRYNFDQNSTTGAVTREFNRIDPGSGETKYFHLVNQDNGKVLGVDDCTSRNIKVQSPTTANSGNQLFSLTNNGRLRSKLCPDWYLTKADLPLGCKDGGGLELKTSLAFRRQQWTFHRDGSIVNDQCGQWNGNLAISAIEDGSITMIDHTDDIPIRFVNPESNLVMGLESGGSCTNTREVTLQTDLGLDEQIFYLNRVTDGSGNWNIYSKACNDMVLEIDGIGCEAGAKIQLYSEAYLRLGDEMNGWCLDASGNHYQHVFRNVTSLDPQNCFEFCEMLPLFEQQVGIRTFFNLRTRNKQCNCFYEAGELPSENELDEITGDYGIEGENNTGTGPMASSNSKGGGTCYPYNIDKRNEWKIAEGKIESAKCEGMVMEIKSASTSSESIIVLAASNERGWNQEWTTKSDAARLLTNSEDPSQQWKAVFIDYNYDFALLPGFPGSEETMGSNKEISKSAMYSCDESMSLLIGRTTSVGTLRAVANLVKEEGPQRMPGECCMDVATNSEYFGYRYDPVLNSTDGIKMTCVNRGPWHLGISQEACDNAGGSWYRTPCVTLQGCIDDRPPRFELDNPKVGSCQDNLNHLNTAYVYASTSDPNFAFDMSCFKFCQSLPDYPLQIGMDVEIEKSRAPNHVPVDGSWQPLDKPNDGSRFKFDILEWEAYFGDFSSGSTYNVKQCRTGKEVKTGDIKVYDGNGGAGSYNGRWTSEVAAGDWKANDAIVLPEDDCPNEVCVCLYNNGQVPNKELLPKYATPSLPKFSLKDPTGKFAFGLSPIRSCNSSAISIEVQKHDDGPGQKFRLTYDGNIVSVACPNKVLAAKVLQNGQCSKGDSIQAVDVDDIQPSESLLRQWTFDTSDGSIRNVGCPQNLMLSAIKEHDSSLTSDYFALENEKSHLTMGFMGTPSCQDGAKVVLQKTVYGNPSQQFYLDKNNKIVSAMCPQLSLGFPGSCESLEPQLHLSTDGDTWNINSEEHTVESTDCPGMFVAISNGQFDPPATSSFIQNSNITGNNTGFPETPTYDNNTESDIKHYNNTNQAANHPPTTGTAIILSSRALEQNQLWLQKHERFQNFQGPFSFVNPSGDAISAVETKVIYNSQVVGKVRVQLEDLGSTRRLDLREVQVFDSENNNVAFNKTASQSSVFEAKGRPTGRETFPASNAVNGNLNDYSSTRNERDPWWEVDLGGTTVDRVIIYPNDGLNDAVISLFDLRDHVLGTYIIGDASGEIVILSSDFSVSQCAHNMELEKQTDDYSSPSQQFYLGRFGSIISSKCPGLVVSIGSLDSDCSAVTGQALRLQTYQIKEKGMKWKLNNYGSIESVKCPGIVIGTGNSTGLILQHHDTSNSNQIWRRQNARLLTHSLASTVDWMHSWTVSFDDSGYNMTDLQEFNDIDRAGVTKTCYQSNQDTFNRAFEDFVSNFAISNNGEEDQCRLAREEMGFDSDHPFDTEVCQKFSEHMCDPFFTGIDHMTETLSEPPKFEQVEYEEVGYEDVGYEEVEYEAPDYADDPPLGALGLDKFPSKTAVPPGGEVNIASQERVVILKNTWRGLHHTIVVYEKLYKFTIKNADKLCEVIPVLLPLNLPNPGFIVCKIVVSVLLAVMYVVSGSLDIAFQVVDGELEVLTLGPDQDMYGYEYTKATNKDLHAYGEWNKDALTKIAINMNNQHTSMRQHLQDRHTAMETNVGQDIFDAQNALGQAIVDSQNDVGQAIVDARNANGQGIVDARNEMSNQHNAMLDWLKPSLNLIYKAVNGSYDDFIGPLEENQLHAPLQLHWPEGQPTLAERLEQIEIRGDGIQEALNNMQKALAPELNNGIGGDDDQALTESPPTGQFDDIKENKPGETIPSTIGISRGLLTTTTEAKAIEILNKQMTEMKRTVEESIIKTNSIEGKMISKGKFEEMSGKVEDSVKEMKEIKNSMDEMREMMSQMMKMMG